MAGEALRKTGRVVVFTRTAVEYTEPVRPDREVALKALWAAFGDERTTAGKQAIWDRIGRITGSRSE
jgi:hypothetical protein